jgi:hypothetical protein
VWEFINSPSPLVFVKIGDRQIDLINAKRINGKFFHTKLGVFELDGEYENTMMGQPFYIHNLQNAKPISLRNIEKIQNLYRKNNTAELTDTLKMISEQIEKGMEYDMDSDDKPYTYVSPLEALSTINKDKQKLLDDEDIKFIVNYKAFDMADLKIFNFKKISELKPDRDESRKIPTIIPMVIVAITGIGIIGGLALGGIGRLIRLLGSDPDSRGNFIMGIDVVSQIMGMFT